MTEEALISVLVGIVGALLVSLCVLVMHWIRDGFVRNDREHKALGDEMKTVGRKVDHVILNHQPKMPPFEE